MPNATFDDCDLTKFCRLDELGLEATGQRVEAQRAVLAYRVVEPDDLCHSCGSQGTPRGTVSRKLAHEPMVKLSRRALRWALEALVLQHLTVARVAESLAVRWNTANDSVLAEGRRLSSPGFS